MTEYSLLILTDHTHHSPENSLYAFVRTLVGDAACERLDVATRAEPRNGRFFNELETGTLWATRADESFGFHEDGRSLLSDLHSVELTGYSAVWLRLPPPLSGEFLRSLSLRFPDTLFINRPEGILEAGTKSFLLRFPEVCPPMKHCTSKEEVLAFSKQFPIVLKPLREYGGQGLVRIDGRRVWRGNDELGLDEFLQDWDAGPRDYLAVKFLDRVAEGDKRIVVVGGEVMGAALRLPPTDSWICNVARGGQAVTAEADEDELAIIRHIHPTLAGLGIFMYGVDTLVGPDGKRVLSEINSTSIGGLPQIAEQTGRPLVERAMTLFGNFIMEQ